LSLALIILWTRPSAIKTQASVPTAIITFVICALLPILSYTEHTRTARPSLVLNTFLIFSSVFDAARARTLWLQRYNHTIAVVFTVTIAIKIILLILEAALKRHILRPEYRGYSFEATSGIINRSFFWWLNLLFRRGYSQTFQLKDLYPLDKHLLAGYLQPVLENAWQKGRLNLPQRDKS